MEKFKLKRLKKAGIIIGITLTAAATLTACSMGNISFNDYNHSTYSDSSYEISKDYIDAITSSELNTYDDENTTIPIKLDNYNLLDFQNTLTSKDYSFKLSEYYELDEALNMYKNTQTNKSTNSELLNNGKLDKEKLKTQVLKNNQKCMSNGKNSLNSFYIEIGQDNLNKICTAIANVVNSRFNDIEISKVANTLTNLTIFEKQGSASNAYITDDLTFVYNPTMSGMYGRVQEMTDENLTEEKILESIIVHEIMHLLQYSTNDLNNTNGVEAGICRLYNKDEKKVTVDSLWNSWILEAGAELGMSEYLNFPTHTYSKKISYIKSYNLSRFNQLDLRTQGLEETAYDSTLEDAFKLLELDTTEEQKEFLKFLYSIEITQESTPEFWDNYKNKTQQELSDSEKTALRMNIRQEAVKYMSKNFYDNLSTAIYEQNVKDLNTVFYLIRNWEMDCFGHLEYTKTSSLPHAKEFIVWQNEIQNKLFEGIAQSNGKTLEEIQNLYNEYNMQISKENQIYDNCTITAYSDYTNKYITDAKKKYTTGHFSRNSEMINYLNKTTKKTESITK